MSFLQSRLYKRALRGAVTCLVVVGMAVSLVSCGQSSNSQDILTQKETEPGRTRITVLVKHAFSINTFEEAVEKEFPDIDLVQVGNYVRDMGITEYASRLEHDDLTDIVMTWPLDVGEEYWEDRLLDLSGMEFANRYNLSILKEISKDGKLYYLPGPSQVRGIIYNKTMFQEHGWQVPKDFDGFVSLCQEIEKTGIRSIQLGFGNSEVLNTAFVGYGYSSCFSKPQDSQWISDYNNGSGSFGDHFGPALDTFQKMIDAGIWKPEDLKLTYTDREEMIFSRKCAMVEDSVLMARMGYSQTGITDEFALMPFFNPGDDPDWARLYMVCYVGLNKHLAEPQNKAKYDLALKLMDYISSEEGQSAMSADTGAMFSSLIGVPSPDVPEIQDLLPALEHGRFAIFPELKNAQSALYEGLAGMLKGELSKEDVVKLVDAQNADPVQAEPSQVIGTATADFTMIDTGSFVTDAMRNYSGCDVALFMDNGKDGAYNNKGISGRFYQGDVTLEDVARVLPDLKNDDPQLLWKVTMTGQSLMNTLEYSIQVNNASSGWFYYFSGLKLEFAPTEKPGSRIKKITMADGSALDLEKIYSVAVMDYTVSDPYLLSCEVTDTTITSIVENAVRSAKSISPSGDGRFKVIQ